MGIRIFDDLYSALQNIAKNDCTVVKMSSYESQYKQLKLYTFIALLLFLFVYIVDYLDDNFAFQLIRRRQTIEVFVGKFRQEFTWTSSPVFGF